MPVKRAKVPSASALLRFVGAPSGGASLPTAQEAEILRCGLRCFAEAGYAATSVRTIAAAAGVTAPMINYYFGSKEELYARIVALVAGGLEEDLDVASRTTGDVWSRLMALMTAAIDFATAAPDAAAFVFDALYGCRGGRPELDIDALEDMVYGVFDRLLAGAVARRELRLRSGCRLKDVRRMCISVIEHVIGRDFSRRGRIDPARRGEMVREAEALLAIVIQGATASRVKIA